MKAAGTLRDVKEGRIKAPHAVHTKFGYFEFYTLNNDWWVGNGCRSFSCTPDTPVFVPETVTDAPPEPASPALMRHYRQQDEAAGELPVFLRKQAD